MKRDEATDESLVFKVGQFCMNSSCKFSLWIIEITISMLSVIQFCKIKYGYIFLVTFVWKRAFLGIKPGQNVYVRREQFFSRNINYYSNPLLHILFQFIVSTEKLFVHQVTIATLFYAPSPVLTIFGTMHMNTSFQEPYSLSSPLQKAAWDKTTLTEVAKKSSIVNVTV